MMTTRGDLDPPVGRKMVWGALIAVITSATLFSGSVDAARAMAASGAIPFSAILMLQVAGFLRTLRRQEGDAGAPPLAGAAERGGRRRRWRWRLCWPAAGRSPS